MSKKIMIAAGAIILVAVGGYFLMNGRQDKEKNESADTLPEQANGLYAPSEQANETKFNEYFKSIYLGKIAVGEKLGYEAVPQVTAAFEKGKDQYCTVLEAKKAIPEGSYASAIYDLNSKKYAKQKTTFPGSFPAGTNAGCGDIPFSAGIYEYKAYINDVLVSVFPFEIRDASLQNSPINAKVESSAPAASAPASPSPVLKSPVLNFSAGGCDESMDPYTEPFEGITGKNWSSNALTINAYVKTLCEGITINGSYKLSGANLALQINMTHSGPQGDCYCARKLTYKISDLAQKDYQISIVRGE